MKTIPVDRLTTNFINLLEEIATTGDPIELDWQGKRFQILPVTSQNIATNRLDNLVRRPNVIIGDPEDLVSISWEHELNLDLP
jgi:hypothetical protein